MTEGEFGHGIQFGHRLLVWWQEEQRIIAKACVSSGLSEDLSLDRPFRDTKNFSVTGRSERAAIPRLALTCGDMSQGMEQAGIVALVKRFPVARGVVGIEGITGGANAGRSFESVDLKARVVGQDDLSGSMEGVVDGLCFRVAIKGKSSF